MSEDTYLRVKGFESLHERQAEKDCIEQESSFTPFITHTHTHIPPPAASALHCNPQLQ